MTRLNTTAGFLLLRGGASHHAASLASAEKGSERTPTGSSDVVEIRTTPIDGRAIPQDPPASPDARHKLRQTRREETNPVRRSCERERPPGKSKQKRTKAKDRPPNPKNAMKTASGPARQGSGPAPAKARARTARRAEREGASQARPAPPRQTTKPRRSPKAQTPAQFMTKRNQTIKQTLPMRQAPGTARPTPGKKASLLQKGGGVRRSRMPEGCVTVSNSCDGRASHRR